MKDITAAALAYHSEGKAGKITVIPSKSCATGEDLSLAYTPGVAKPCLEINKTPDDVWKYTSKGNLVAVVDHLLDGGIDDAGNKITVPLTVYDFGELPIGQTTDFSQQISNARRDHIPRCLGKDHRIEENCNWRMRLKGQL